MMQKIQKTFAQDGYEGEWIDGATLTSKLWLGSHAEDYCDGYHIEVRRAGWRWPTETGSLHSLSPKSKPVADESVAHEDLLAMFAVDDDEDTVLTSGYSCVDHCLPLKDRLQQLADTSFGAGRVAVDEIETSGPLRIARISMLENPEVTQFSQSWWFQHFQGSSGSVWMKNKIHMTFAQDAYAGDWIDGAMLTSRFSLGSHAEEFCDGYHLEVRRTGWHWPEEYLVRADKTQLTVEIPTRLRLSEFGEDSEFTAYEPITILLRDDECLVQTQEIFDPSTQQTILVATRGLRSRLGPTHDSRHPARFAVRRNSVHV